MATTIASPELRIATIWVSTEQSVAQAIEEIVSEHPERQPEGVTPLDILARQRAILIDPERWVQGPMAIAETGEAVDELDGRAVAWCNIGSIHQATVDVVGIGSRSCSEGECGRIHCIFGNENSILEANHAALGYSNGAAEKLGLTNRPEGCYWNDYERTTHDEVMRVNALACQLAAYDERTSR